MDGTLLYFDTLTVVRAPTDAHPSLQVPSGTLGPQRNTQQVVTFTVGPDGVAVTRKFGTREAGAQTWSDHVQANPRTDPTHTLTATGSLRARPTTGGRRSPRPATTRWW